MKIIIPIKDAKSNKQNLGQIKLKLNELRNLDKDLEVFGVSSHEYTFNPVVSAKEVDDFEAKYGCSLPDVYRAFLLEIGNGGAGPSYGVFPLEAMDNGFDLGKWPEYINPSKPFVFTESFNDTSMLFRGAPEESDFSSVEKYNQAYHLTGDGVAVPVVRHIAENIFEPIVKLNTEVDLMDGGRDTLREEYSTEGAGSRSR